jgi:GNAT superfamily N-acetyltransferase
MSPPKLVFHEVDGHRWPDFEALFSAKGAPSYCWCMVWRTAPRAGAGPADKKAAMRERIAGGVPVGLLGYLDDQPVAWCSIAPRATYRPLGGLAEAAGEQVWSLVCMYVRRDLRGLGVARQLIDAAVAHARRKGATVVEAYPVDPDSPSYRFMGFVQAFQAAGFERVGQAGKRRHVARLTLA